MDWQILAPFLSATLILMLVPGPVVAMVAHNTLRGGPVAGLMTSLGVEITEAILLGAVFAGLIASQELLPLLFRWISFAGIAYLVWLAIGIIRTRRTAGSDAAVTKSSKPVLEGMTIALSNPTTFFFYTAFFPQFVTPHQPLLPQLILLGSIYLVASFFFDMIVIVAAMGLRSSTGRIYFRMARHAELGSAAVYFCVAIFALIGLANVPA